MRRGLEVLCLLSLLLTGAGCEAPEAPEAPPAPGVVARFAGGTISAGEVDAALLELPVLSRPRISEMTDDWLLEFMTELTVDRLVAAEAELMGIRSDPQLRRALAEHERSIVWSRYLQESLPTQQPAADDEVRALFESLSEGQESTERRLVRNLFVRRRQGEASAELVTRAEALRDRVLAGESFETLARAHSSSETRHRGGLIGWTTYDDLPSAAADIVFALDERETSAPVLTREGAHLFYVESTTKPEEPTYEALRGSLQRRLAGEERERVITELVSALPQHDEALFVARPEELSALVEAGDPAAIVLRSGTYEVSLGDFLARLDAQQTAAPPIQLLERLEQRERVYHAARAASWLERPDVVEAMDGAADGEIGRLMRERGMRRLIDEDPGRLEAYYDDHAGRFNTPLQLHLERLTMPAGPAGLKNLMLGLEDAYERVGAEGLDLEALAAERSGTIEDLGWLPFESLGSDTAIAGVIARLSPGETSPPFQAGETVEMIRVVERRDPEPRALAAAIDEVREAFLADRGQNLYLEWRDALLTDAGAEIFSERLALVREAAYPRTRSPASADESPNGIEARQDGSDALP